MKAAWYERQGPAREVLQVGDLAEPEPGPGELRIRICASGVHAVDIARRQGASGSGMPDSRVVPHSDGAGEVDRVGAGVAEDWLGERVWCFGGGPHGSGGTAAEYVVVPARQAVLLPAGVTMEQGACLGAPGITGHRAVNVAGPVSGRTVLVRGAAKAVGLSAVHMAHRAGARVFAEMSAAADEALLDEAGAHELLPAGKNLARRILDLAPDGVDHIVEDDLAANIAADAGLLVPGGSIAACAGGSAAPVIPFPALASRNAGLYCLDGYGLPLRAQLSAARDLNAALKAGWPGFRIAERMPLSRIAAAHDYMESGRVTGCVVVVVRDCDREDSTGQ